MKFTLKTIINNINFDFYPDLYPGYSYQIDKDDECMFNNKSQCEKFAKNIVNLFDGFPKEFPIYRSLKAKSIDDINRDDLGESWSFDLESARQFGSHNGSNFILSAIVTDDNVDWYKSMHLYLIFSGRDDADDENEIVVIDTNLLKNLTISNFKEAKEIEKNPIFTRTPYVKSFENWITESKTVLK